MLLRTYPEVPNIFINPMYVVAQISLSHLSYSGGDRHVDGNVMAMSH